MRGLLVLALCLSAAVAQAEEIIAPAHASIRERGKNEDASARQRAKGMERSELDETPVAKLSISLVDDGDTVYLPPTASRSTPRPMPLLTIGIRWAF
jgi:hypothetical protein